MDLMKKGFRRTKPIYACGSCGVAAMDLMKKGFRPNNFVL